MIVYITQCYSNLDHIPALLNWIDARLRIVGIFPTVFESSTSPVDNRARQMLLLRFAQIWRVRLDNVNSKHAPGLTIDRTEQKNSARFLSVSSDWIVL